MAVGAMAATTTKAVLLAAAVLLGMDLVSTVVTGPPPLPAVASASASPSAAAKLTPQLNNLPPGLHVKLCTACSYKGYYNQLATQLQQLYGEGQQPPFRASASTYPPSLPRRAAAGAATVAQAAALAVTLAGDKVLPAIGVDPVPSWYETTVKPRRTTFALASWFVPNLARQAAESTGAFEVFWDGELLFSKLRLGRFPTAEELAAAIDKRVERKSGAVDL
jgi:selT/selW/selH-like putative selenoprotein